MPLLNVFLGLPSLLAGQRLIDHKQEGSRLLAFQGQHLATQDRRGRQPSQHLPAQEARNLRPVPRFGANGPCRSCRSHAAAVQQKRHDTSDQQSPNGRFPSQRLQKTLEFGRGILHDNHREAPSSAGPIAGLPDPGLPGSCKNLGSGTEGASFLTFQLTSKKRNFKTSASG